jgi:DNA-binding response OmpR family regulator
MVVSMSLTTKILIVSDLQSTSPLWAFHITQPRWDVTLEPHPAKAVERWAEILPDLIVCDIDSESVSIETVTKLREQAVLPILLLTSNYARKFILDAYEAGVDECILKPIEPMLLEAKLRAWLRRSSTVPTDVLEALIVDDLHLIPSDRVLVLQNKALIHLTNLELRLLYYLMGRPGRTLTTEELCYHVWSHLSAGDPATLKNLVYRLRRKIEADPANPQYLHTVAGVGYRFMVK